MPGPTLYDVLGVQVGASVEELRRAYRSKARTLHPDRHATGPAAERAAAERQMQELTAAYRVLGDEARRRRYDLTLDEGQAKLRVEDLRARFASRPDGTVEDDDEVLDGPSRLIRGLPWIALVGVLVVIFVFSAYALTGGPKTDEGVVNGSKVGTCVTLGPESQPVPASCGAAGARPIVALVPASNPCPDGTERVLPPTGSAAYCIGPA